MNRRQKIIVSVTGIFLVLLILLGLTYAYFITKVQGNDETKSISLRTANLFLKYYDGNGILEPAEKIIPGTDIKFLDSEGNVVESKTFSVKNEGNATIDNYGVILEDLIVFDNINQISSEMVYPDDLRMSIKCESSVDGKSCNGITNSTFPTSNDILLTNTIDRNEEQIYTLTMRYEESGSDQSADMGKTISAKINIIDMNNTVDLIGRVATYNSGDYVQVNSTPRVSQISTDKTYKVVGLEPGTHTIRVLYKDENGDIQTRGEQTINILKGDTSKVEGNTITISDESRVATVNVSSNYSIEVEETIQGQNPYNKGTLAYEILNNAMHNKNETRYRDKPLSIPGEETSYYFVDSGESEATVLITSDNLFGQMYADDPAVLSKINDEIFINNCFIIDTENQTITPTNNEDCGGANVFLSGTCDDIKNKYINKDITGETIEPYLVTNCDGNGNVVEYVPVMESVPEKTLTQTVDNYGTTYYFRGDVKDNYVNFANMCWRIVRIVGDGTIKLVLEDQNQTCSDAMDSNWNIPTSDGTTLTGYTTGNYGFTKTWYDNGLCCPEGAIECKPYLYPDCYQTYIYDFNYLNPNILPERAMVNAYKYFQNNSLDGYTDQLKNGDWCLGFRGEYDGMETNIFSINPSLKSCSNNKDSFADDTPMYVAGLTADEIIYAGAKVDTSNTTYYLNSKALGYYTLSPIRLYGWDDDTRLMVSMQSSNGSLSYSSMTTTPGNLSIRPAISLRKGITISGGDGTINSPYKIR